MSIPVSLCGDFKASQLRALARKTKDGPQAQRLLALAAIVAYMIHELTSLFVGLYCALLVVGLIRLAQGQAAWDGFVAAFSSPLGVSFQLVCLAFAIYHSVTWFALTPKAMPLMIKDEAVPGTVIVGAHYATWAMIDRRVDCSGDVNHGQIE